MLCFAQFIIFDDSSYNQKFILNMLYNTKVIVVLSSYNGEQYIRRQLDSIFSQKEVCVTCYVRDDGSTDKTLSILESLTKQYPNLIVIKGENIGWKASFMEALKNSGDADYYAFSDQDDIWFEDKLKRAIEFLEKTDLRRPALYHSNRLSCNEELIPLKKQTKRIAQPLSFENSLVQEYCQGCTMVFNKVARDLACKCYSNKLPHDYWIGLISYIFGTVIYEDVPTLYHIHHGNNASTDGDLYTGWIKRLMKYNERSVYVVPANILLNFQVNGLTSYQVKILRVLILSKNSVLKRLLLVLNNKIKRINPIGTLSLKTALLLNKIEII